MIEATFKLNLKHTQRPPKKNWNTITQKKGSKPEGPYHQKFTKNVDKLISQHPPKHIESLQKVDTNTAHHDNAEEIERKLNSIIHYIDSTLTQAYQNVVPKSSATHDKG